MILNEILSTILKRNVWRSVWRICSWTVGLKGLIGSDLGNRPLLWAPLKQACYEANYAE